jgi:Tol biopolymer transport system component
MRIGILFIILSWLFISCKKGTNENQIIPRPEDFNYTNLKGIIAFSRSNGKIIILDGDKETDKTLTLKDGANIWDASVSLSADAGNISYSALTDEGYQVFKMSVTGSNNLKLTKSLSGFVEHYDCPVWSSGGDQIFYVANGAILLGPVYSIKPDGTDLKQITDFDVYRRISVSSDNSFIVYANAPFFPDITQGIFYYSIQTDSISKIITYDSTYTAYSPVLSPDDKKVAFVLRHGFNEQGTSPSFFRIMTINLDGTDEKIVKELPMVRYVIDTYVTWSPDGTMLAFNYGGALNGDQGSHIFIINSDGTGLTQVTNNTDFDNAPSWVK